MRTWRCMEWGLTSLQYREEKGAITKEVQATVPAPKQMRLAKKSAIFTMWLAGEDGKFVLAGTSPAIALNEPFWGLQP